ncbi:MAG: hypothetical protein LLG42_03165 [Chloroflexi bacterium]|nr:hypothetical protein [Chloroflexota bacterium]
MASIKTTTSELIVGFGLLGISPISNSSNALGMFDRTLSENLFQEVKREFREKESDYNPLFLVGKQVRESQYPNITKVRWTGGVRQGQGVSGAYDLFLPEVNTNISVKMDSDAMGNRSPENLFRNLPQSLEDTTRGGVNWFIDTALPEIQELYAYARNNYSGQIPHDVREFFSRRVSGAEKENFTDFITGGLVNDMVFSDLYVRMAHKAADAAANEFIGHFSALPTNRKAQVADRIARTFFRIDSNSYIYVASEGKRSYALRIPSLTDWKANWKVTYVNPVSDNSRGQGYIKMPILVQNKADQMIYTYNFHIELRWSHGKFCGNPEAKLYKDFDWSSVRFFEKIVTYNSKPDSPG